MKHSYPTRRSSDRQFDIEQACGTGSFEPLARMNLHEVIPAAEHPDDDVAFDPARNSAPGVELWPGWLRRVRRQAYDSSREGRDARSEEHTSELQSLMRISYAVFCLKKKNTQ